MFLDGRMPFPKNYDKFKCGHLKRFADEDGKCTKCKTKRMHKLREKERKALPFYLRSN